MKKRIALLIGHPDKKSYNYALAAAYKKGAIASGFEVQEIRIADLRFDPNLKYGYRKSMELEPDLVKSQEILKWANHWVWVYPVWWGGVPAMLKGFIDRVLLPGFAFRKRENSVWWDKHFKGVTASIICTLDQPSWYYTWINRTPSHHAMKKLTLQFIGVQKVRITTIGSLRLSKPAFRAKWLQKVERLGELCK